MVKRKSYLLYWSITKIDDITILDYFVINTLERLIITLLFN